MANQSGSGIRSSFLPSDGESLENLQQTKLPYEDGYAGELRGYYPPGRWSPASSRAGYDRVDASGTKLHDGVDVYAPYFPFPYEIPVYAFAAGKAWGRSYARQPNANGNRLQIETTTPNTGKPFTLAHLNRFRGRFPQWTEIGVGQVIGYVGYSGNAGEGGGPPKTHAKMNIGSGHVHFQLGFTSKGDRKEKKPAADPLAPLGWKLRFAEGSPLFEAIGDPQEFAAAHGRAAPPKPLRQEGFLVVGLAGRGDWIDETQKGGSWRLREPHDLIDFDRASLLRRTEAAFGLAARRLADPAPTYGLAKLPSKWNPQARCVERFRHELHDLMARTTEMRTEATAFGAAGPNSMARATHLMRLIFAGALLFYDLLGGRAIAEAAAGTTEAIGGSHRDEKKKPIPFPADLQVGEAPECGIGLWGETCALAIDRGQGAIHRTNLRREVAGVGGAKATTEVRKETTWSVSFGAGTEWHAVLDDAIFQNPPPGRGAELLELARETALALTGLMKTTAANGNSFAFAFDDPVEPVEPAEPVEPVEPVDAGVIAVQWAIAALERPLVAGDVVVRESLLDRIDAFCRGCLNGNGTALRQGVEKEILTVLRRLAETGRDACRLAHEALGRSPAPTRPQVIRFSLCPTISCSHSPPGDYPTPDGEELPA